MKTIFNIYFFCFIMVTEVVSHPHVFIETSFVFVFGDEDLKGIAVRWSFDEIFSAPVIMDNDRNRNGVFEESEVKTVETRAFSNLKNYDYFLRIEIDGKKLMIKKVTDFKAEIAVNRLVYYFYIPLCFKAGSKHRTVLAGCYDKDYFCDIKYAENPVKLEGDSGVDASWEMLADKKSAYWGGFIVPDLVHLKFRIKDE